MVSKAAKSNFSLFLICQKFVSANQYNKLRYVSMCNFKDSLRSE